MSETGRRRSLKCSFSRSGQPVRIKERPRPSSLDVNGGARKDAFPKTCGERSGQNKQEIKLRRGALLNSSSFRLF